MHFGEQICGLRELSLPVSTSLKTEHVAKQHLYPALTFLIRAYMIKRFKCNMQGCCQKTDKNKRWKGVKCWDTRYHRVLTIRYPLGQIIRCGVSSWEAPVLRQNPWNTRCRKCIRKSKKREGEEFFDLVRISCDVGVNARVVPQQIKCISQLKGYILSV